MAVPENMKITNKKIDRSLISKGDQPLLHSKKIQKILDIIESEKNL